jgi:uncharacterized small protein (DUF1192 family)
MAEQEALEWYEYDELEQQIAVLERNINAAVEDLNTTTLSDFSRRAIMNEVESHYRVVDDLREKWGVSDEQV